MQLAKSLQQVHDEKLLDVIGRHVASGRDNEIRQALPSLIEQRPHLAEQLAEIQQQLSQTALAPEMITSSAGVALTCTNCGGSLSKQAAETRIVICQYCGQNAELPNNKGSETIRWPRTLDFQSNFTLGSFFNFKGEQWQAIGVQHFGGTIREWDSEDSDWETNKAQYTLWWMLNKQRQLAWISDYGKTRYWSYKYIPEQPELPARNNKAVEYGDWKLQFAAGEFSYNPSPGEKKKTWEHSDIFKKGKKTRVAGNSKLSIGVEARVDASGKPREIEFFRHLKLSNHDVITGIGASESLHEVVRWKRTGMVLIATAVCSLIVGTVLSKLNKGSTIFEKQLRYTPGQTIEIGKIYIEDAPALLKFKTALREQLPVNKYVEFEIEFSNDADQVIGWYGAEFWRETGYDEGHWDEHDYNSQHTFKVTEPGAYHISGAVIGTDVLQNINDAVQNGAVKTKDFDIALSVSDGAINQKPFFLALFAGLAGGIVSFTRSGSKALSAASLGGKLAPPKGKRRGKKRKKTTNRKHDQKNTERQGDKNTKASDQMSPSNRRDKFSTRGDEGELP